MAVIYKKLKQSGDGSSVYKSKLWPSVDCCDKKDYDPKTGIWYDFSFGYNPDLLLPNGSIPIEIRNGCPDFDWSTDNSHYTFTNPTTSERINTLNADGAADTALLVNMTVEDSCGNTITAPVPNFWSGGYYVGAEGDDGYVRDDGSRFRDAGELVVCGYNNPTFRERSFIRFVGIKADQGDTVQVAKIKLQCTSQFGTVIHAIYCNAADDAVAPTNYNEWAALTRTTSWHSVPCGGVGVVEYTITEAVQEVIDRPGWSSGNAIMVLIDDISTPPGGNWYRSYYRDDAGAIDYSQQRPMLTIAAS